MSTKPVPPAPRHRKDGRAPIRHLGNGDLANGIEDDVRRGLSARPKFLPPKYFYDERGSWLFEQICQTPEYYLTRTEEALLTAIADDVIDTVRPGAIVELGSGSSHKTEQLLRACDRRGCHAEYLPFDVSSEMLLQAAERLLDRYPWLRVQALIGDYCRDLGSIPDARSPRLFLFLGSTIGNFDDAQTQAFLQALRAVMTPQDRLLIGFDRVKDPQVLHRAYNDAAGLTAQFNINVLRVVNRYLAADFDLHAFTHRATYNRERARIEMYLDSRRAQTVHLRSLQMHASFDEDEPILTEISRKFTVASFGAMLAAGRFAAEQHFQSADQFFSLMLARALS